MIYENYLIDNPHPDEVVWTMSLEDRTEFSLDILVVVSNLEYNFSIFFRRSIG